MTRAARGGTARPRRKIVSPEEALRRIPGAMRVGPFVWPDRAREYAADVLVHLLWFMPAVGAVVFALMRLDGAREGSTALLVYGLCFCLVVAASTANNMAPLGRARAWLSRIDRAVIYPFIAATVGAFLSIGGLTSYRAALLATAWVTAGVGVFLKLGFPGRFHTLGLVLYLGLGWFAVLGVYGVMPQLGAGGLGLLLLGGVIYSVGVPVYLSDELPYRAALWHGLCTIAGVCHLSAIAMAMD